MTDLALVIDGHGRIDIDLTNEGDLVTDESLRTAIILSLLLDHRALPGDEIPDGSGDRRGWWADAFAPDGDDAIGSRLWLLHREKDLPEVRRRAERYGREALQWIIDDGVAQSVEVTAETASRGLLELQVIVRRGEGDEVVQRFQHVWESV